MALDRPTLAALYARTKADFVALSETGGAILRRSVEWVLARIVALLAHGLYAYIEYQRAQSFPDTADEPGVRQWGGLFGVGDNPATAATGPVVFTGTNTTNIPAGTEFRIGTQLYTTDALGTISGGEATIAVTASELGADGNAPAAATGSLTNPIAGIDSVVTVDTGGLTGGTDVEGLETYRARVLARLASPPMGGSEADYEAWIREVPEVDVHRVWVYPWGDGVGTVVAAFTVVESTAVAGFRVASAPEVEFVQDYVDAAKPIDVRSFRATTPTGVPLTLTIAMELEAGAVEATVEAAAEASILSLLYSDAVPETALPLSRISEAVSTTAGEREHAITSPVSNPTPGTGNIFTEVTVTWS